MNKLNLSTLTRGIHTTMSKHSPEILTAIGIVGMLTTTVMAVRATPKALELIEEEKSIQNVRIVQGTNEGGQSTCMQITNLKPIDVVKITWRCYTPATVMCVLSIFCLIGANSVNARRNVALATAYTLSETALKEYQEKVIENIGEKKEQSVRDAIAKGKLEQNSLDNREVIITEKGNTLCYDAISGRYFKSDIDIIKRAVNEINKNMLDEMYVSLNDFYYEIGLDNTKLGDDLGWNINNGLVALNFSSQLASNGTPCLVMDYSVAPKYDFY